MDASQREWLRDLSARLPPATRRAVRCHLERSGFIASRRVLRAAARWDGIWLSYANPSFLDDRAFVQALLQRNGMCLISLPPRLQQDMELATLAVRQDARALMVAPAVLLEDRALVLKAASYPHVFQRSPAALRDDAEVALAACAGGVFYNLKYASERLRRDPHFVVQQVRLPALQNLERLPLEEALLRLEESRKDTGHLLRPADVLPAAYALHRDAAALRVRRMMEAAARHGYDTFCDEGKVATAVKSIRRSFPEFTPEQVARAIRHDWNAGYR